MATTGYRWHTIAKTFQEICNNQEPWVALGNFLNDWWFFATENRREMVKTPLAPAPTRDENRWAAFCAAMVEWLCWQDDLPIPAWTSQQCYILPEPWFLYEDWGSRSWLLATTPAPFKMRNIYGGDRMFNHVPRRGLKEIGA
jgi:hypothetical protein